MTHKNLLLVSTAWYVDDWFKNTLDYRAVKAGRGGGNGMIKMRRILGLI